MNFNNKEWSKIWSNLFDKNVGIVLSVSAKHRYELLNEISREIQKWYRNKGFGGRSPSFEEYWAGFAERRLSDLIKYGYILEKNKKLVLHEHSGYFFSIQFPDLVKSEKQNIMKDEDDEDDDDDDEDDCGYEVGYEDDDIEMDKCIKMEDNELIDLFQPSIHMF